jgi:hypothetical protein
MLEEILKSGGGNRRTRPARDWRPADMRQARPCERHAPHPAPAVSL